MAKATVKVPSTLKLKVRRDLQRIINDPILLKEVKDFSLNRVKQFARLSKSMEGTPTQRKLPVLSPGYQKSRKSADPRLTDPEFFRPASKRSNLTFTGQLMKSLKAMIKKRPLISRIEITFTGRRDDGLKNINVYRELTKRNKNYEILSINKAGAKQIKKITQRFLRRKLSKRK